MKDFNALTEEITALTAEIETDFPELYQFLEENPLTIPNDDLPAIPMEKLMDYLTSLKELLLNYVETHREYLQD
ncbi:MAG: hypothetical protein AAB316_21425 [Bacteroidota bacterium]